MSVSIDTSSNRAGYISLVHNSFKDWAYMVIGSAGDISSNDFSGIFEIKLNNLFNKKIAKITKINFDFVMRNSSSGYNGCVAKIDYIGKNLTEAQMTKDRKSVV